MAIKGIVCIGANGVMGNKGAMPWGDTPLDGRHFQNLTKGHTVVMGRKTFESMGMKPLPNRRNIVMSKDPHFHVGEGFERIWGMNPVFNVSGDIWIIGGATVFGQFLPYIEEFYVTAVGHQFEGDTYLPDIHEGYKWKADILGMDIDGEYPLTYYRFMKVVTDSSKPMYGEDTPREKREP